MPSIIIAIDLTPSERLAWDDGLPHFPIRELHTIIKEDLQADVKEILCTLPKKVPENDSPEAVTENDQRFEGKRWALEMNGARVIVCPAKRSEHTKSGFKQSDDQRLTIKTLTLCMKLKPDYLFLFAGDGDYAPLLEELRNEGIKCILFFQQDMVAKDVRRVAWDVRDIHPLLQRASALMPQH
jgi:uncharacterized LabA/DUF88 family protein